MIDGSIVGPPGCQVPIQPAENFAVLPLGHGKVNVIGVEDHTGQLQVEIPGASGPEGVVDHAGVSLARLDRPEDLFEARDFHHGTRDAEPLHQVTELLSVGIPLRDGYFFAGHLPEAVEHRFLRYVEFTPDTHDRGFAVVQVDRALFEPGNAHQQVHLAPPDPFQPLAPASLDVLDAPVLLSGDVLQDVGIKAAHRTGLVLEKDRVEVEHGDPDGPHLLGLCRGARGEETGQ